MKSPVSQTTLLIPLFIIWTSFTYTLAYQRPSSFIKASCTAATYPSVCSATLSAYASEIKANPKTLATKSLYVAQTAARSASGSMARLSRFRGLNRRELAALSGCTAALRNSAGQLQRAIDVFTRGAARGTRSEMVMSDVQTWTSTALTYAGTCMEEVEGGVVNRNVKIMVRREITRMTQLTSNALALVNSYGSGRKAHRHHHHHHKP